MSDPKSFHMSPEEFRRQGHAVVDWIADYQSRIEELPGSFPRAAGRNSFQAADQPPGTRRGFRPDSRRPRPRHPPRHYALAVAQLLRLFSSQRVRARHSWRSAFFRVGRARHALVDQSGMHGTGDPCARLAGPDAGPAGKISFDWRRRRRDSGHGFQLLTLRPAGRARAGHPVRQQPQRLRWTPGCLLLHANPFLS